MCLAGVAAAWHAPSARLPSPLRAPSSRATTAAAARATPDAAPAEIGLDAVSYTHLTLPTILLV